ncbi:hypothetical protein PPL_07068 [Heterostelium album PN500]|uniref:Uncharacterized protein n=1 Tax=Heterostelium pallidum (strain ATCC 26659 / Pp 5 / PN500) TaxID=670386 RepID=D3BEB2_HETP5|nr:hypothetical protein PPL_07068 [Heterostelium album PN500]EFA80243.1 hypothetical protein PPL_07068 [Heterostelium album PN500]|eukprot:XP_020432363.1 hypothetical protein PPL_07068 [Heterostelium album PN500]
MEESEINNSLEYLYSQESNSILENMSLSLDSPNNSTIQQSDFEEDLLFLFQDGTSNLDHQNWLQSFYNDREPNEITVANPLTFNLVHEAGIPKATDEDKTHSLYQSLQNYHFDLDTEPKTSDPNSSQEENHSTEFLQTSRTNRTPTLGGAQGIESCVRHYSMKTKKTTSWFLRRSFSQQKAKVLTKLLLSTI